MASPPVVAQGNTDTPYGVVFDDDQGQSYLLVHKISETEQIVLDSMTGALLTRKSTWHYNAKSIANKKYDRAAVYCLSREAGAKVSPWGGSKLEIYNFRSSNTTATAFITYHQYFSGGTLHQFMEKVRDKGLFLPQSFILSFARQMLSTLHKAYNRPKIMFHHHLNPHNIYLRWLPEHDYPEFFLTWIDTLDRCPPWMWDVPDLSKIIEDLRLLPNRVPAENGDMFRNGESPEMSKWLDVLQNDLVDTHRRTIEYYDECPDKVYLADLEEVPPLPKIEEVHFHLPGYPEKDSELSQEFSKFFNPAKRPITERERKPTPCLYATSEDATKEIGSIDGRWKIRQLTQKDHSLQKVMKMYFDLRREEAGSYKLVDGLEWKDASIDRYPETQKEWDRFRNYIRRCHEQENSKNQDMTGHKSMAEDESMDEDENEDMDVDMD